MRWSLTGAVLAGAMSSQLMARESEVLVSDPSCIICAQQEEDMHSYNRAIAFGSVMLAQNGSNVSQWKEVRTERICVGSSPKADSQDDGSSCVYRLMITTLYRFMECPDGRAFILRSGEGINVRKPTEGDAFGWSEDTTCRDSPVKSGNPLDPKRALDMERVTFTGL